MATDEVDGGDSLQTSATDADQLAFAEVKARAARSRRLALVRGFLAGNNTAQENRELLYDHWLADLGVLRHLPVDEPAQMYGRAALHNLGCRWMAEDITPNRDLFIQMQNESLRRQERDRNENASSRAPKARTGGTAMT